MELRYYAAILRRRLWIIALVVIVVASYAAYQYYSLAKDPGAIKSYQSTVVMQVGLQAGARNSSQPYSDYMSASDMLAEQLTLGPVLTSKSFATQVSQQIQADMGTITQLYGSNPQLGPWRDSTAISSALTASRIRTMVSVNVIWSTQAGAWAIANAVGEVSSSQISNYFNYGASSTTSSSQDLHPVAAARVINAASSPSIVAGPGSKKLTLLALLLLVALVISIALAFLVEYLDDRIRSRETAIQLLQLSIIGEAPRAPLPGRNRSSARPA